MQSKCDSFYFMSDFAKYLCKNGHNVLLMDLSGSGDSFGEIENITVDSIKDDIRSISRYIHEHGYTQCYAAARGLSGNVLVDIQCSEHMFNKIICINPVWISDDLNDRIKDYLLKLRSEALLEINEECYTELEILFKMAGTEKSNIEGEMLNAALLKEISDEAFYNFSKTAKDIEVFYTKDFNAYYENSNNSLYKTNEIRLSDYNDRLTLMKMIVEMTKSCCD